MNITNWLIAHPPVSAFIVGLAASELLRRLARRILRHSPAGWLVLVLKRIETRAFRLRTMVQQSYPLERQRRQAREAEELRSILEEYGGVSGLREVLTVLRRIEDSTT
jgi:hypothetical protein